MLNAVVKKIYCIYSSIEVAWIVAQIVFKRRRFLNCHSVCVCAFTSPGCSFNNNELGFSDKSLLPPVYSCLTVKSSCVTSHFGSNSALDVSEEHLHPRTPKQPWMTLSSIVMELSLGLTGFVSADLTALGLRIQCQGGALVFKRLPRAELAEIQHKVEVMRETLSRTSSHPIPSKGSR